MKPFTLTHGPTLSRPMPPESAGEFVADRRARRGRGSVLIAVSSTERDRFFDVDAVINDLTPSGALDVLAIAAARVGAMHNLPPSRAVPIDAQDLARMERVAGLIVDMVRHFGFNTMVAGRLMFFRQGATFKNSREHCIRALIEVMAEERARGTEPVREAAE